MMDEVFMAQTENTMFDQILFPLSCGHSVTLWHLSNATTWKCQQEDCGKVTDLRPHKTLLAHDWDTADQIDKQARDAGKTVVRAFTGEEITEAPPPPRL
jgi:hypothetical protein